MRGMGTDEPELKEVTDDMVWDPMKLSPNSNQNRLRWVRRTTKAEPNCRRRRGRRKVRRKMRRKGGGVLAATCSHMLTYALKITQTSTTDLR